MKNYTITVNGNVYEVTVEEGFTGAASAPKAAATAPRTRQCAAGPPADWSAPELPCAAGRGFPPHSCTVCARPASWTASWSSAAKAACAAPFPDCRCAN